MNTTVVANALPKAGPEIKFKAGAVSATVWRNHGHSRTGEDTEYRTVSLERVYPDKEGKWQSTNSLRVNDLPRAWLVLQKAFEHVTLNHNT